MRQALSLLRDQIAHCFLPMWCFGYAGASLLWSIHSMVHPHYSLEWVISLAFSLWFAWNGVQACWRRRDRSSQQAQKLIEVILHYNLLTLRFHLEEGEQTLKEEERYEELAELHELQNKVQEAIKNFNAHETD